MPFLKPLLLPEMPLNLTHIERTLLNYYSFMKTFHITHLEINYPFQETL